MHLANSELPMDRGCRDSFFELYIHPSVGRGFAGCAEGGILVEADLTALCPVFFGMVVRQRMVTRTRILADTSSVYGTILR